MNVQPYVVRQGDYLAKIASKHNVRVKDIWNHPRNAELRTKRGSPSILFPGDVLFIPQEPRDNFDVVVEQANQFVTTLADVELNLRFKDVDDFIADEACEIHGNAQRKGEGPAEKVTDHEGRLRLLVSPFISEIMVSFPRLALDFPIHIGGMDPIEEISGVNRRLANLGFASAAVAYSAEGSEALLTEAIRAFQTQHALSPSGELDEETRQAIITAHGA